jgi:hypothetical protein
VSPSNTEGVGDHSLLRQTALSDDPGSAQAQVTSIMADQTEYRRVLLPIDDMPHLLSA